MEKLRVVKETVREPALEYELEALQRHTVSSQTKASMNETVGQVGFANVDSQAPEQDTSYFDRSRYLALVSMFEIDWVNGESIHGEAGILEPHGRAVKVDQHPFVGVEVE